MCGFMALGIASVAMTAFSAYQASRAQKDQADYQAGVARNNAVTADRNADEIERQGTAAANRSRAQGRLDIADQAVSLAAQGADITTGSNVDLLADSAEANALDAATIRSNAGRDAYNMRVRGSNFNAQAGLFDAQADAQNPALAGLTSGLSAASSVSSRWNRAPKLAAGGASMRVAPRGGGRGFMSGGYGGGV